MTIPARLPASDQVLSLVDKGSVSTLPACHVTRAKLQALHQRLLQNQAEWHGGVQPQTKLYSITQVSCLRGLPRRGPAAAGAVRLLLLLLLLLLVFCCHGEHTRVHPPFLLGLWLSTFSILKTMNST